MFCNRREFITLAAGGIAVNLLGPVTRVLAGEPFSKLPLKAIAFDAFPIFDPRPVFALAEQLFPGNGNDLSNAWRTRQFEYTWLRVTAGNYADFWQVTREALEFAADQLKLELTQEKRERLMNAYLELKTWPDVMPALTSLKKSGFRLSLLSNLTPAMLDADVKSAGLTGMFEQILSTDQAKTYKPDPRAYQLGVDALGLKRNEILFVAFAGWDAAGAKLFGYPTFWVNRQHLPPERMGAVPDGTGETLTQLVQFLARYE
jgi:2-haloacid dehalogenase